jgi:hypothetical protein
MWNIKCMITPVMIGDTGMVTKGLKKILESTIRKHCIDSLQKPARFGVPAVRNLKPERWRSPLVQGKK